MHIQAETPMGKLPAITGRQLRRSARSMGPRKAAGADGLQASDWTWWPLEHWDRLVQLGMLCEQPMAGAPAHCPQGLIEQRRQAFGRLAGPPNY